MKSCLHPGHWAMAFAGVLLALYAPAIVLLFVKGPNWLAQQYHQIKDEYWRKHNL